VTRTPEGRVKARISKLLADYGNVAYVMPIGSAYGVPALDYIGAVNGCAFVVEAKAPGGKVTARQAMTLDRWAAAGAMCFVVQDDAGISALREWLVERGAA
jgi:hypothetical protein